MSIILANISVYLLTIAKTIGIVLAYTAIAKTGREGKDHGAGGNQNRGTQGSHGDLRGVRSGQGCPEKRSPAG
jgi:hypothetical protein